MDILQGNCVFWLLYGCWLREHSFIFMQLHRSSSPRYSGHRPKLDCTRGKIRYLPHDSTPVSIFSCHTDVLVLDLFLNVQEAKPCSFSHGLFLCGQGHKRPEITCKFFSSCALVRFQPLRIPVEYGSSSQAFQTPPKGSEGFCGTAFFGTAFAFV